MSVSDIRLNLVSSYDELAEFVRWFTENQHDWISVDTETGGLDWWRDPLRLVQIGDPDAGWAIPWQLWGGLAKEMIESYQGPIAFHNSKFDLHFLEHNGIQVPRHRVHDTMPMVGLLEPTLPKGLKPASERHVFKGARQGDRLLQSAMDKGGWDWATVPIDLQEYWGYAALDVVLTSRLARKLYPDINAKPAYQAYTYEVAVAQVLTDMERAGLLLDLDYIEQRSAALQREEDRLREFFDEELGVSNPLSDRQLIEWFQNYGYVFTKKTEKGNTSLDSDVLEDIAEDMPQLAEIAKAVTRVRNYHKTRNTYFESFLDLQYEGRLHTSINPMRAITGRMSSSRPNLQNVPSREQGKMVRSAFVAPKGHKIISADFDQIEYRIMVSRAGEQRLIEAINAGQDLHTYMTAVVFNKPMEKVTRKERDIMKNATFAFLYGAGDVKFAGMAGVDVDEAKAFRQKYAEDFPAIARYAKEMELEARGGGVTTEYLGRPQQVKEDEGAYKLLNYVTQGEAGDVLKKKLVELAMTDVGPYMRLPIHDEILFEVPEEEVPMVLETIKEVMPENDHYDVPLSVGAEVLDSWGDKYS